VPTVDMATNVMKSIAFGDPERACANAGATTSANRTGVNSTV
jgi:hypothetical protein